jgi:hypothetical protein
MGERTVNDALIGFVKKLPPEALDALSRLAPSVGMMGLAVARIATQWPEIRKAIEAANAQGEATSGTPSPSDPPADLP